MNNLVLFVVLVLIVGGASFAVGWYLKDVQVAAYENHLDAQQAVIESYQCQKQPGAAGLMPQLLNISIPTP